MKRITTLTCALALLVAGAAAAQPAQPAQPAAPASTALASSNAQTSVSGTVVSSTSSQLVIDSEAGTRMTFSLDPTSTARFTAGERVTVEYHTETGGTVHRAMRVAAAQPAPLAPRTAPDAADDDFDDSSTSLPATAGSLPLIGLLGLLAIGGAVAVRVARS